MRRWLTNTRDPDAPWQWKDRTQQAWLMDKRIGRPKATDTYTVEELEAMDMVGVYEDGEKI